MTSYKDRHLLITGGSSGIGLATAELAARRGAHVTIIARDEDRLAEAKERTERARTVDTQRVLTLSCDVSQWEQVDAAVRTAEAENGPVDVLLSCAGYCYPVEFVDMPLEHIDGQVGTNLLGTIYVARAVAPGMVARGRGHIAMVASMGGFIGVYGYGAYAPSKFGVMGFAEVLRSELKPCGIGVSVLCPPNVDSPGYAREVAMEPAETAKINAGTKMVSPASMAEVLLGAVDRNRFLVVPGFMNGLYYRLKGILPEIFYLVFDGDIAAARSREVRPDAE